MKSSDRANLRTQATILAEDIFERMRANRQAALSGDYDIDDLDAVPDCAEGASVSACDLSSWKRLLERQFHSPVSSSVDCTTNQPICLVLISIDDTRGEIGTDRLDGDSKYILELGYRTRL